MQNSMNSLTPIMPIRRKKSSTGWSMSCLPFHCRPKSASDSSTWPTSQATAANTLAYVIRASTGDRKTTKWLKRHPEAVEEFNAWNREWGTASN